VEFSGQAGCSALDSPAATKILEELLVQAVHRRAAPRPFDWCYSHDTLVLA
jgi:hypothetical protein